MLMQLIDSIGFILGTDLCFYSLWIFLCVMQIQCGSFLHPSGQGFMQNKSIASHTCFGGHMDVNC